MSEPTEVPKRLTPDPDTLRLVYLVSGNECAFEGCDHPIIDRDGVYVAQLCHIEAAMPGGERFNVTMSNEERRAPSNLMLLCHRHHKITDDVVKYTVPVLAAIKAKHEARFSEGIGRMLASEVDHTLGNVVVPPMSLAAIYSASGWTFDAEEHAFNMVTVVALAERLRTISQPARQVLEMTIRRGRVVPGGELGVLVSELCDVTGSSPPRVAERVGQLESQRFAYIEYDAGYYDLAGPSVLSSVKDDEWPTLIDLKHFCERSGRSLGELIVDLDFTVLD